MTWRPDAGLVGRLAALGAAALFVGLYPLFVSSYKASEFVLVGIYFIAILGLNILSGYNGQISLGHGAFMGIGAYTTAILVSKYHVGELWTIPLAALVAGGIGFLFGFPALRLSGVYLALATFGLAVAFVQLAQSFHFASLTGGGTGLSIGLPKTPYYLTWGIAAGLFCFAWLLLRGRIGRAFTAVRDAPLAAVSSGVSLATYKTLAFGISAAYAGVAGSLFAMRYGFINPLEFSVALSILLLTGAALGGLGSLEGMIFGALFIQYAPGYGEKISKTAPSVMYGVILLAVLFLVPGGAAELIKRLIRFLKRAVKPLYSRTTPAVETAATSRRSET